MRLIEIEVEETPSLPIGVIGGGVDQGGDIGEMLGGILPKRRTKKRVTVAEALRIFEQEEAAKLIDMDAVKREALRRAGEDGIIFIDEIDKVAGSPQQRGGPDVSREGVQRDILPIVEGSTVNTKHGPIKTDHILFIAAGAFHISKPSDLIPGAAGASADSRRARLAHRRGFQNDSDAAEERARRAVQGTARYRWRNARVFAPTRSSSSQPLRCE